MNALALFLGISLLSLFVVALDQRNITGITAELGHSVILPCQAPSNIDILAVKWITLDLEPEYVFFYRDGQIDSDNQHPSFKERVKLNDSHMKNGNVSLILKNVTKDDAGTYECHVKDNNNRQKKTKPVMIIKLHVTGHTPGHTEDGGNKGGRETDGNSRRYIGLIAGLSVTGVTLLCFVVFITYKRHVKKNSLLSPNKGSNQHLV